MKGLGSGIVGVWSGGAYAVESKGRCSSSCMGVIKNSYNSNDMSNINSIGPFTQL